MVKKLEKAVVLARGLGTRMRRPGGSESELDAAQARMADTGLKAMNPMGRPFLDYSLSGLADAGYREVCLVIGPEHDMVRRYYSRQCFPRRIRIQYAIQEQPRGTADALASAEAFAAGEPFLMINSDNYYPVDACRALLELGRPAIASFERDALIRESNIAPERLRQFAVALLKPDGTLARIIEKPGESTLREMGREVYLSMNCWCFGPAIFQACQAIGPSPRDELEIADAVNLAIDRLGEQFQVLKFHAGVLDLSSRMDISAVANKLKEIEVDL